MHSAGTHTSTGVGNAAWHVRLHLLPCRLQQVAGLVWVEAFTSREVSSSVAAKQAAAGRRACLGGGLYINEGQRLSRVWLKAHCHGSCSGRTSLLYQAQCRILLSRNSIAQPWTAAGSFQTWRGRSDRAMPSRPGCALNPESQEAPPLRLHSLMANCSKVNALMTE